MELKYSIKKNELNHSFLQAHHGVCAVSCENITVFTQVHYHSSSFKRSIPVYTTYVADLNSPFEAHVIMESLDQITQANFDSSGQQLLIVSSSGSVYLYIKGSGLHQWLNTHTSDWNGEEILYVDFFHTKNKAYIQVADITLNAPYSEKFQCKHHQPSLKTIGNCSQNGFFAVTASGLILACTFSYNGIIEEECKAVLGPIRDNFVLAAASLAPSGHIHVAAWKPEIVKCWEIELSYIEQERIASKEGKILGGFSINGNRKLQIKVQSTQSFSPSPIILDPNILNSPTKNFSPSVKVTHLKFTDHEDPSCLLLFVEVRKCPDKSKTDLSPSSAVMGKDENVTNYFLQRYQLIEKTRSFHKFFQDLSSKESTASTTTIKEWVCQAQWLSCTPILALNTPPRYLFPNSSIPYAIIVSTNDGIVYTINRETMQMMNKYNFQSDRNEEMTASKWHKACKQIVSLAPTWTSLHLLALDSQGGLHFLTLLKPSDVATGGLWALSVMLLLEYSLVTNCDCWDILMVTPPNSIVTLSEKLTDNFNQHPAPIISNLLSKFLVLKNVMLRFSGNLHQRSMEAKLQAQLSAMLKLFHSLRPVTSEVVTGDKNLSSVIQGYIESRNSLDFPDLDKSIDNLLMYSCNILDCQIDPTLGKDLQTLLQFATDLALYLLLLLVQNPKYEIAKEKKILQYLREILFISRIWYRHNKLVIPQMIKKSDSVDIWAQLYKLLTRLAFVIPNEPDTGFLDDCVALETQVVCREVPLFIPPRGVMGCLSSSTSSPPPYPIQFTNGQADPNPMVSSVSPRPLEGSLAPTQPLDSLYYHFLGANGPLLQCTRCYAVKGWGVSSQLSMWEQEWANRCICSGHWAPILSEQPSRLNGESGHQS